MASLDNYSPVSKVSVVVNAGARYEIVDNLGITHCLRTFANLVSSLNLFQAGWNGDGVGVYVQYMQ